MADFIGDFVSAASDLAHELRCAAGTVLTILGSRLEADARARVECGPQWLTEFEEARDHLEPNEVGECICWVGHGNCGGCSGVLGITHEPACGWQWDPDCPQHGKGIRASASACSDFPCSPGCESWGCEAESSAATPDAADPSPANANTVRRGVGDEGPGEVSDILPSASPGQPKRCKYANAGGCIDIYACTECPPIWLHAYVSGPPGAAVQTSPAAGGCGRTGGADSDTLSDTGTRRQQGDQLDPGAVSTPASGELSTADLLAAAANQLALWANCARMTGQRQDYLGELIPELQRRAAMFDALKNVTK